MEAPKTFLPKGGSYENLTVYKKATIIYDLTFYFTNRFLTKGDRTIGQMVQAARSGKQNIAEGSAASSTSSETELKLMNVARASMQELLVDYEDYLRVRNLLLWPLQDERAVRTREFCKTHTEVAHYMTDIERRSDEALANIAITLIHQFDNMMGKLLDRLQTDFVEKGGIREQMTAARLGYRNEQKDRIAKLEAENHHLKARIAELEQKLKGPMRLIGLISLMGLMGLMGCSKEQVEEPVLQEAICFNGGLQENTDITAGTRAEEGTPLSDLANTFQVWAFKNMSYEESTESYAALQEVMHDYTVNWRENSANTTISNSSGWEYVNQQPIGGTEQSIKYWDLSAKAYKFFGYVLPTTGAVEVEFYKSNGTDGAYEAYEVNGNYSKCRMSFTTDAREEAVAPYFSKLWFSNNSPGSEHIYPSMVKMQFFKPFAKVRFMFKFAAPDEPILIELPHFFPTNQGRQIHLSGTFRLIYPLTGDETKESWETEDITYAMAAFTQDYYEAAANETDETVLANQKHWYTVLPAKNQGAYTLTVRVNGEERACYVPAEYMDWLPGYSYTYIFKVNEDGGVKFDAINIAFTDWQGNTEKEKIVYNW